MTDVAAPAPSEGGPFEGAITKEFKPDEIPFATNGLSAPVIYADYIRGTMIASGVAKLNLVDNRVDALSNEVKSVHVGTIVVPIAQVKAWGVFLTKLAEDLGQ
jgi:hypothetical protein